MSKQTTINSQEQDALDLLDADIADEDYVFVIGPDGELKSILLPDDVPFKQPKNIGKILKLFNITDVDNLAGNATLH